MSVSSAVARGEQFSVWTCEEAAPVLYIDAEMALKDLQDRARLLGMANGLRENPLLYLSDDHLVAAGLPRASLVSEQWRDQMMALVLKLGVKVVTFDNLASLCPGIDENSKQDWDPINQWLLDLRFNSVTSIMVHHVNKEGGQRGTSAREDNVDVSIRLDRPPGYMPEDGAKFIAHFSKARVPNADLHLIKDRNFHLWSLPDGKYEFMDSSSKSSDIMRMIKEGKTNKEIAYELGVTSQYVSKLKKQGK